MAADATRGGQGRFVRPCLFLAAALSLLAAPAFAARGGRIMAPAQVSCDPNQLTSYFGKVTAYKRDKSSVWLRIATDYDTVEEVTAPVDLFLYMGRAFTAADWKRIESKPGVLRKGTRATAFVCRDGKTPPLVDWNGAAE